MYMSWRYVDQNEWFFSNSLVVIGDNRKSRMKKNLSKYLCIYWIFLQSEQTDTRTKQQNFFIKIIIIITIINAKQCNEWTNDVIESVFYGNLFEWGNVMARRYRYDFFNVFFTEISNFDIQFHNFSFFYIHKTT